MICPACQTSTLQNQNLEQCVQCGTDIHLHRLLYAVKEKINMKDEIIAQHQYAPQKISKLLLISQVMPSILLLICALFGIFIGFHFLSWLNQAESHKASVATQWSETGLEQLQQMTSTIKQELELIIDQRQENLALQKKLQILLQQATSHAHEAPPAPTVIPAVTPAVSAVQG